VSNTRKLVDIHKFETVIVEDGRFLEKAQVLRRKVFFKEAGKDEDRFDKFCQHLVVIEKRTKNIVGTYRLFLRSVAEETIGFYSETEFDLKNIKKNCRGELLEIGRACVDETYRKYPIINLMWKAIISYIEEYKVKFVFGCASIDNPSPQNVGKIFRFFKERYFSSSRLRVHPLAGKRYPYIDNIKDITETEIMELLPSLIKGYLKMGAIVCGDPAWDKTFNTADFFMLLNTKKINITYRSKFL